VGAAEEWASDDILPMQGRTFEPQWRRIKKVMIGDDADFA
jgi:hypothetical protein